MRKSWSALFLIAVLAGGRAGAQEAMERALAPAVERLCSGPSAGTVLSFGTFKYADKKVVTPFSRYLEEALSSAIPRRGRVDLSARDTLDAILSAQELNLSDLVDEKTAVPVGKMKGVQALLSGTFFDAGVEVKAALELVSVETATVLSRTDASVPCATNPATVAVVPENYADALHVLDQLALVKSPPGGALAVKAWNVRGDGGTYCGGCGPGDTSDYVGFRVAGRAGP